MKRVILYLFFSFCLFRPGALFADGDVVVVLKMVEQSLTYRDTLSAREMLNQIAQQCEQSDNWNIRFHFYLSRGYLNYSNPGNLDAAIDDLQHAWDAFPSNVAPTPEFLTAAEILSQACYKAKRFDQTERIAAKSLVRAMAIVNDCLASSSLFSLLAKCYEQRGDTIMPSHFHRKSQELSVKNYIRTSISYDSLELYYKRLKEQIQQMDNAEPSFNRSRPEYLFSLDYFCNQVTSSGNVPETIFLAEKVLQTARDSMLLTGTTDYTFFSYMNLLYAYAANDQLQSALDLLTEAEEYYSKFPDLHITKAVLYYNIAYGIYNCETSQNELAFYYFRLSKEGLSDKYHNGYINEINSVLGL